jgi:RNA polymerase sigma-70 factor (ECF subfamily)
MPTTRKSIDMDLGLAGPVSSNLKSDPFIELSDEQLVEAYLKDRRPDHFETLMRRYERELYTFLRRFLGNAQHAEDVFQGTFLSVHLRIEQFEPGKRFRPWLYAIASNKAIDFMRRNKRHQMASLDGTLQNSDSDESMVSRLSSPGPSPDELAMQDNAQGSAGSKPTERTDPATHPIGLLSRPEIRRHRRDTEYPRRHREKPSFYRHA